MSWKKAILLWLTNKVDVLEYHTVFVHSAREEFALPSVIRLKRYIRPQLFLNVRLTRQNVFLRDNNQCQYCTNIFSTKRLTIDHVIPVSKGGKHSWNNVVAACSKCNNKKGSQSVQQANLTLLKKPSKPKWLPNRELALPGSIIPRTWKDYL